MRHSEPITSTIFFVRVPIVWKRQVINGQTFSSSSEKCLQLPKFCMQHEATTQAEVEVVASLNHSIVLGRIFLLNFYKKMFLKICVCFPKFKIPFYRFVIRQPKLFQMIVSDEMFETVWDRSISEL